MPKIIAAGTLKGGTGKTSFIFNIAGILAQTKKVLLIDGDPQFNLTTDLGIDVTEKNLKTIKDVFEYKARAEDVIYKHPIAELPNLDAIPSSIELTATELKLVNLAGREQKLRNFFQDNADVLAEYEVILMDTNPNVGMINQNIFLASNSIILVSDIDANSIRGAEFFIALWDDVRGDLRKEDNVAALVLNNADNRSSLPDMLFDYCQDDEELKRLLVKTVIPNNIQVKNSKLKNQPLSIMQTNSNEKASKEKVLSAYQQVLSELTERGVL